MEEAHSSKQKQIKEGTKAKELEIRKMTKSPYLIV